MLTELYGLEYKGHVKLEDQAMGRVRSPNYPAISLPEAIKAVASIHLAEQHLAAPKEVVAKHLGYTSFHGLAGRMVSAIEKYGLLEEVSGDKVKVSPLAMSILFPATPEEKQKAINEAAFKPPLFTAIREEWQGSRPSDENLRVYLVRKKFGSDALDRVIEVYKETMDLVTQDAEGYVAEIWPQKDSNRRSPICTRQQGIRHRQDELIRSCPHRDQCEFRSMAIFWRCRPSWPTPKEWTG